MNTSELLTLLVCPRCRLGLARADGDSDSVCCRSGHRYPLVDGVPLLFTQESLSRIEDSKGQAENRRMRSQLARFPWLESLARWMRPPHPFRDPAGARQRARMAGLLAERFPCPALLDIGGGLEEKNLSGLPEVLRARSICLDIQPSPGVSVAADGKELPFKDASVEGVLLQGVLEHVPEPYALLREAFRVLRPGGIAYVEVPFLQHFHYDPDDFYRFTLHGLEHLTRDFSKLDGGVLSGPGSALCDLLTETPGTAFDSSLLYWGSKWIAGWATLPLKYLDILYARSKRSHMLSGALFFLGAKPW